MNQDNPDSGNDPQPYREFLKRAADFERVVVLIFRACGAKAIETTSAERDLGYDFAAHFANLTLQVAVKYFRSSNVAPAVLDNAVHKTPVIYNRGETVHVLVVSTTVAPGTVDRLLRQGLLIIDGPQLVALAFNAESAVDVDAFNSMPSEWIAESTSRQTSLRNLVDARAMRSEVTSPENRVNPNRKRRGEISSKKKRSVSGEALCKDLHNIKCGKVDAKKYEKQIEKILRFLFDKPLESFSAQHRTFDGMSIMDLVCRIRHESGYWRF